MLTKNTFKSAQRCASRLLPMLFILISATSAQAQSAKFDSGERQVALVELFTSEGCSSCPPADAALSYLNSDPNLFKTFVPVAFHVDYWNRLGWDDRFADSWHADRQYKLLALNGRNGGYTPNFIVDGKEWKGFFRGDPISMAVTASQSSSPGRLVADLNNGQISAEFQPSQGIRSGGALQLHVAQLGMNFVSHVTGGENNGRTLRNDFVVLNHETFPMSATLDSYIAKANLTKPSINTSSPAIAIWVSMKEDIRPIQATGGLLAQR